MKTVWILNHYAQEPGHPGGTRHFSLSRYLPTSGWRAFIIAASVEHNTGRQRLAEGEKTRLENFDGVPFLWVRTPGYKGNGGGRIKNILVYFWRTLRPVTTRALPRPNVIIGSTVHPLAALSGMLLARRFRIPFIYEVRDLWPQSLIDIGKMRAGSFSARALYWLERLLLRGAARIIVLLPQADKYIVPIGIPKERIVYLPNGVELCEIPAPPTDQNIFTLMYFGAHGQPNGLDCVLRAMHHLKGNPLAVRIRLRLIGNGSLKPGLVELAKKLDLDNVQFEPPVSKREIPALASTADAFIFNLVDGPAFRFGISSNKLFDFLAASRPIIFSCKASNNPVNEAHAGLTVPPNQSEELAKSILTMASLPIEERIRMGRSGRAYVEANHSFEQIAKRLASVLDESLL